MTPLPDTIERTVTDPTHGSFRIRLVESRAPAYVSFRWASGAPRDGEQVLDTLCEFFLRETAKGVEVRVVESGWSALADTPFVRRNHEANVQGWESEMAALQEGLAAA